MSYAESRVRMGVVESQRIQPGAVKSRLEWGQVGAAAEGKLGTGGPS